MRYAIHRRVPSSTSRTFMASDSVVNGLLIEVVRHSTGETAHGLHLLRLLELLLESPRLGDVAGYAIDA